ncbi:MAG: fliA [Myxococcales bacterium]|nr:fliA [Myxococcales bacterium]
MQAFGTTSRDRLISEHTDAARRIALRMARKVPDWIQREDLIAAGMIGLIEAADRYDASRLEPFLSYAEHRIRGAVLDELRRGDIMPRRLRQLARKVAEAIRALESSEGEPPTEQRVATALGVSIEEYRSKLSQLVHIELAPLDQDLVADELRAPDAEADHRQTLDRVRVALSSLEQRDVTILGLHYVEDLTYQEIADTMRITPSRVCQLLWRAVDRLRLRLGTAVQDAA